MLLAQSKGSKGIDSDNSFSIYIPILLSAGYQILIENNEYKGVLGGHPISLQKHHGLSSLTVGGFATAEECLDFIAKFQIAINWAIVKRGAGIKIPALISDIQINDQPILIDETRNFGHILDHTGWTHVDGDYYADKLVIIPESKRLVRTQMGQIVPSQSLDSETFINDLSESFKLKNFDTMRSDKKLKLAIEIYSSYNFEVTITGRFIKLVTTLEALLPEGEIEDMLKGALKNAKRAVNEFKKELLESDDFKKLEKIKQQDLIKDISDKVSSRIGELKYNSIGTNLESYLTQMLSDKPQIGNPKELIPKIRKIYEARSKLLHDGIYNEEQLNEYLKVLSKLVPTILRSYFDQ